MRCILIALAALCTSTAFAQSDFCDAVSAIMGDAPARFRNVRGRSLSAQPGVGVWESAVKVPGTISGRFVSSMGAFYEGALYQARTKEGFRPVYEKWRDSLATCMLPKGYKLSEQPNFYPGMAEFKKVVFMKDLTADVKIGAEPPHVALEAQFSKELARYALVMFVYEH